MSGYWRADYDRHTGGKHDDAVILWKDRWVAIENVLCSCILDYCLVVGLHSSRNRGGPQDQNTGSARLICDGIQAGRE